MASRSGAMNSSMRTYGGSRRRDSLPGSTIGQTAAPGESAARNGANTHAPPPACAKQKSFVLAPGNSCLRAIHSAANEAPFPIRFVHHDQGKADALLNAEHSAKTGSEKVRR